MRLENNLPLRKVAARLDIDTAILSKMERSKRRLTRDIVSKLAKIYGAEINDLIISFLSDKIIYQVKDERLALESLKVAEERIAYRMFQKTDRKKMVEQIKQGIKKFGKINKAWIYGSFARGDDGPFSDVDIAIKTEKDFSYFDMAEIQHNLESKINRKVDIGFIDSFKPYILEHVKPDMKLIYERQAARQQNQA